MFKRSYCRASIIAVGALLLSPFVMAGEISPPSTHIIPQETGVLFLPALDATPDAANMLLPRQAVIRHREQAEFIKRQFKVLGESLALRAAVVLPRLDLTHASDRTEENFDELAKRAKADWVVGIIVESVEMVTADDGEFKASTRLLLQIWDAREHRWLINGACTREAAGKGSPPMLFMQSLDQAVRDALAPHLNPFPPLITLKMESSLVDYLEDQTTPFIADLQRPFAGLSQERQAELP